MNNLHVTTLSPQTTVGSVSWQTPNNTRAPQKTGINSQDSTLPEDQVTISQEAREKLSEGQEGRKPGFTHNSSDQESNLSQQELLKLHKLQQRDAEVRAHEQAHLAAAGQYARGGSSFTYERGADGVSYAVAGKVGIDLSQERRPEDTLRKMQTVRRAALAPMSPSAADRSIAARAGVIESQARMELLVEQQQEMLKGEESSGAALVPNEKVGENSKDLGSPSPNMVQRMLASYRAMSVA